MLSKNAQIWVPDLNAVTLIRQWQRLNAFSVTPGPGLR